MHYTGTLYRNPYEPSLSPAGVHTGMYPFAHHPWQGWRKTLAKSQGLPLIQIMTMAARVDNVKNKIGEQLKTLRKKGMREVNLGVESCDGLTFEGIKKGHSGTMPSHGCWHGWIGPVSRHAIVTLSPIIRLL